MYRISHRTDDDEHRDCLLRRKGTIEVGTVLMYLHGMVCFESLAYVTMFMSL
jgi:hypothetical protein